MKSLSRGILMLTFVTASIVTSGASAARYDVDRSFSQGLLTGTLTGRVEVPVGHYVIQNGTPNPFTSVDLLLTVNLTPYNLTHAITSIVSGSGQFVIDATPTTLTFNAIGDGTNPADLAFSATDTLVEPYYGIGSDGDPRFEAAYTSSGIIVSNANVNFPVVFGTIIPEPTALSLILAGLILIGSRSQLRGRRTPQS